MIDVQPRPISTTQGYAEAFEEGQTVTVLPSSRLLGRILRGKEPGDFDLLAADERRLVFAMGGSGLEQLCGQPLRQSLETVGLTPDYVQGRIDQGYYFKLAVFQTKQERTEATWKNVLRHVIDYYPEIAVEVAVHADVLPSQELTPEIEMVDLAGATHPDFLSLSRYRQLPGEIRAGSPQMLRRLLLHEVHLGTLFSGDGYTRTFEGARGIPEHIMANGALSELHNSVLIDLHDPGQTVI